MKIDLTTLENTTAPEIQQIVDAIKSEKKKAIESGDEVKANNLWRQLEALKLNVLYIKAFHNIKIKNYRDAWNQLEQCEIACSFIKRNSTIEDVHNYRIEFIENKITKWQSLYPYCVFASPGFKVGYYTCSICGHKVRPRSRCEHKKGKVYFGELCLHVAHEMEILEISIVSSPVQKYSVLHNDETLNFSLIEYLSEILEDAFEEWDINWTTMKFPSARFESVASGDKCPCKSDKMFEYCCMNKEEIEIPHVDFIFSKPLPSEKESIRFPY
ncbi:MAG: hypothetical protein ACRC8B_04640 [Aeromonas sobria]|uniref:hypothetical protein n=1 Tax=Aeromonas sobria TaxID=646 RepID=UPI003F385494